MITDRMPRERKRRWPWRLLRILRARGYWRECRICREGFDIDREMGHRPLRNGYGEAVCWWCGWEGREGALPAMVSWINEQHVAAPAEYWQEPLRGRIQELLAKHEAWRAANQDYLDAS